jgi:hypothetical protein
MPTHSLVTLPREIEFGSHAVGLQQTKCTVYWQTPKSRIVLEKLTVPQLVKNSPHFMEFEGSLPCLHEPPTSPCPNQVNTFYAPTSHFLKIQFNVIPSTPVSRGVVSFPRFPHQNLEWTSPLIRATYPAHLILDLITRIFGEEYGSWSFLLKWTQILRIFCT